MYEKKPIRVGFLVDSFETTAWEYLMVSKIVQSPHIEICLIVKKIHDFPPQSFIQKLIKRRNHLIYSIYRRLENKFIKNSINAFQPGNLHKLLSGVDCIEVKCIEKKASDFLIDADIEKIKTWDVDVFIRLGFRILLGKILNIPKYGIWSLHHGDNLVNRGGPAGFWEVVDRNPTTGSVLQILTEDLDAGFVLYRSWSKTDKFITRNNNASYWKSASFIPRKLEQLYQLGGELFLERMKIQYNSKSFYVKPLYVEPTNLTASKFVLRHTLRLLSLKIQEYFKHEQWYLMYYFNKKPEISFSVFRFRKLLPPNDRFWADPFVLFRNGLYYIFVEEFMYFENKGRIAVLEVDEKGKIKNTTTIIDKKYHLSYPFLIEDGMDLYMIPESSANHSIEMYKCVNFPDKWEFFMNLMDNVDAVDATLFYKDKKWWLFANIQENKGSSTLDELFLFYSESFKSTNWIPHPNNPVISDVRKARPAGKLYYNDGKLYRPSQDSSIRYGYSINFNEIIRFSETEYEESQVAKLSPDWEKNAIGTHTFAHVNNLTVIDCVRMKWRK